MFTDLDEIGIIAKIDVSNLEAAVSWYEDKLGFKEDGNYRINGWAQLNLPTVQGAALGLWTQNPTGGSGGTTVTFVVTDIVADRDKLIAEGVPVGPIENPGDGVLMARFNDPDGNALALRQNPSGQPSPRRIGRP